MTFEDELGPLMRQAGAAHTLPTPAGVDAVTTRYKRRHRRRTGIGGVAAALVLAVASYGVFQATAVDDSSTVATVPDQTATVSVDDGDNDNSAGEVAGGIDESAAGERQPDTPPDDGAATARSTEQLVESITNVVSVDGRYVGFSAIPLELGAEGFSVGAVESVDGQEWSELDLGNLTDSLEFVQSVTVDDGRYLAVGQVAMGAWAAAEMLVSTDFHTWTDVKVPLPDPADGMVNRVSVAGVVAGPAGFLAIVDGYEEIDPARLGLTLSEICSLSGTKESPTATEATYAYLKCGPDEVLATTTVEVPADFQPRSDASTSYRLLFIGDGSDPFFVDAPGAFLSLAADDAGYVAMTTGPLGAEALSRSVDGVNWTEVSVGEAVPSTLVLGRQLTTLGDRLIAFGFGPSGASISMSDDDGVTWAEGQLPSIEGIESLAIENVVATADGVVAIAADAALSLSAPGVFAFDFEVDGYRIASAESDPLLLEVTDPDGAVIVSASIDSVLSLTQESTGLSRDSSGIISVLDDADQPLVRFHENQLYQNFTIDEQYAPSGTVVIEKQGYRLELEPMMAGMEVVLFADDEIVGEWSVDDDFREGPGIRFADNDDLIFTDPDTGEQLLVVTEAEGNAAFEEAMTSGAVNLGPVGGSTRYVLASRNGQRWEVVGEVGGFGGPMAVSETDVLVMTYAPSGPDIAVFPLPEG